MSTGTDQTLPSLPKTDHSTHKPSGHFMYVRPYTPGDTAWLLSRPFTATEGKNCQMRIFFYNYGSSANRLRIKFRTRNSGPADSTLWDSAGQQGPEWLERTQPLSIATPFQIIIEGFLNKANTAVAIDDISFSPDCQYSDVPLPVPTTVAPPSTTRTTSTSPRLGTTAAKGATTPKGTTTLTPASTPTTHSPFVQCSGSQKICVDRRRCYQQNQLCDGRYDCADHSDEDPNTCRECFTGLCCYCPSSKLFLSRGDPVQLIRL